MRPPAAADDRLEYAPSSASPKRRAKRVLDVVVSAALLVICAPLMVLISVAIKYDSAGPVIFASDRVGVRRSGRDGKELQLSTFRMYKFRSMVVHADSTIHENHIRAFVNGDLPPVTTRAGFKLANDARVTRIGRILRATSLDELPQLVNVLRGNMSLVGPRPLPLYEVSHHSPRAQVRLEAVPGLTGLWQVKGRANASYAEMISLDLRYVESQSFFLDLKILMLTVLAVLKGRGAA